MNDIVVLDGILKHGYGIIPKYFMELDLDTILDKHFKENEVYNYIIIDKKNKIKKKTTIKTGIGRGKYMKLVLSYLLSFCGYEKQKENETKKIKEECYPFVNTIAEKLQLSRGLVVDALNDLEALEIIKKEKRYPENSLKRGNKYIIQIFTNSFFDKFESLRGRPPRSTGETSKVYGGDVVSSNNNNVNNNNDINNVNKAFNKLNAKPLSNNHPVNLTKINKRILAITKKSFSAVEFFNRLPDETDETCPTKTYERIQNFLYFLHECKTKSNYLFDEPWMERNHIDFKKLFEKAVGTNGQRMLPFETIQEMFEKSVKNYALMRKEGYWPSDKEKLTLNFANFLYNFKQKTSWFLYCLFNDPKEMQETCAEKVIEPLPEDVKETIIDFGGGEVIGQDTWPKFPYYTKAKELYVWYAARVKRLCKYHTLRGQDGFRVYLGCFSDLIEKIHEFAQTWKGKWSVNNFGIGNKTWDLFLAWLEKEFDYVIDVDERALDSAEERYDMQYPAKKRELIKN